MVRNAVMAISDIWISELKSNRRVRSTQAWKEYIKSAKVIPGVQLRGEYLRISRSPARAISINSNRCQYLPPETCIGFALLSARASHTSHSRLAAYFAA